MRVDLVKGDLVRGDMVAIDLVTPSRENLAHEARLEEWYWE